jgi:8-oxo-dGTP diphosphatase
MSGNNGELGANGEYPVPRVPASAGALIFDHRGRLLILKPTYKSGWTIPGGVMEADGETPWQACRREVREECGLEIGSGRLVCTDFRLPTHSNPGGIRFLFDCGELGDSAFGAVVLQAEEIAEHRLLPLADALPLLRKPIRRRVRAVRKRNGAPRKHPIVYLENGRSPVRRTR